MQKKISIAFLFMLAMNSALAQNAVENFLAPADSLNTVRRNGVMIVAGAVTTGSFVALNNLWYADYERSDFHFINDNAEWLQMDKAGHVFGAYHLSRSGTDLLRWSGLDDRRSMIYGSAAGFLLISSIEIFDGYSANWGASIGDIAANAGGTILFASQELLWKEQRIIPKFSFHTTPYSAVRPSALGASYPEQLMKDYNGQTYWLSANIHSFIKSAVIPRWLNFSVGYGAEGMISANDGLVNTVFLPEKERFRQYYFSFDIDLQRINTSSHLLKTVFAVFNTLKIPAPTLEINEKGIVKFHPIYF